MRRTPLLLAVCGALMAMPAIPSSALAAGTATSRAPAHPTRSASQQQASSTFNCAQPDQDVPGASCDPSSQRGTEQVDHGRGNDCDPGYGGSNSKGSGADHGNDNRFPASSETEVTSCSSTASTGSGGGTGHGPGRSGGTTASGSAPAGAVLGASTGRGGGGEQGGVAGATGASGLTGVSGAPGALGGAVGAAVAGATGVALANTGFRNLLGGVPALLLLAVGFLLSRRRRAARGELA